MALFKIDNNILFPKRANDPVAPVEAEGWYNETAHTFKWFDGTGVRSWPAGPEGLTQEQIEDFVALLIVDSSDLDFTYSDATPSLAAIVKDGAITLAKLANLAEARMLGRAAGAGTGPPTALTGAQIRTILGTLDADTLGGDNKATIIAAAIAGVVDSAPGTLDTLNELAAALGDDANFATTLTTALGLRVQSYAATVGDGAATSFNVDHTFGTRDIIADVWDAVSPWEKRHPGEDKPTVNRLVLTFGTAPVNAGIRVIVQARP